MSDQSSNDNEQTAEEIAADIAEHAEKANAEEPSVEEITPEQRIAQLESELEVAKDRMLRLAADLENTRRRAQKEKNDAAQFGIKNFAHDLLSVADNFQRAIETAPTEEDEINQKTLSGVLNGIRMTEKDLLTAFERNGVKRISPAGEPFDPNVHQAIAEVPGTGEPKGHVVDVAQVGFTIGERVLRAAMVTVSTGAGAQE